MGGCARFSHMAALDEWSCGQWRAFSLGGFGRGAGRCSLRARATRKLELPAELSR